MKTATLLIITMLIIVSCSRIKGKTEQEQRVQDSIIASQHLMAVLDTIWETEQEPITKRDETLDKYGADSKEFEKYQAIYEANHVINEQKIVEI